MRWPPNIHGPCNTMATRHSTHFKIFGCESLFSNCTSRNIFGRLDRSWFILRTITCPVVLCVTYPTGKDKKRKQIRAEANDRRSENACDPSPYKPLRKIPSRFWLCRNRLPNRGRTRLSLVHGMMGRWASDSTAPSSRWLVDKRAAAAAAAAALASPSPPVPALQLGSLGTALMHYSRVAHHDYVCLHSFILHL